MSKSSAERLVPATEGTEEVGASSGALGRLGTCGAFEGKWKVELAEAGLMNGIVSPTKRHKVH
jgi:hypothetical protein